MFGHGGIATDLTQMVYLATHEPKHGVKPVDNLEDPVDAVDVQIPTFDVGKLVQEHMLGALGRELADEIDGHQEQRPKDTGHRRAEDAPRQPNFRHPAETQSGGTRSTKGKKDSGKASCVTCPGRSRRRLRSLTITISQSA